MLKWKKGKNHFIADGIYRDYEIHKTPSGSGWNLFMDEIYIGIFKTKKHCQAIAEMLETNNA